MEKSRKGNALSKTVTAADIAWAVSARTGIPVGRLTANRRERLLKLESILEKQVIGQTKAVAQAAECVRRGLSAKTFCLTEGVTNPRSVTTATFLLSLSKV